MIKRTMVLMFSIFILCMSVGFAETAEFNVGRNQTIPDLVAGEVNRVSIKFVNDSRASVERLEIVPQFDNEADYPFVIDEITTVRTKHGINSKEVFSMPFEFDVKKTATTGKFPFKINLSHTGYDGATGSQTVTLYLNIVNSLDQPQLSAKSIEVDNGVLTHGVEQQFPLK